jgi:acetyl-CoA acetyltransferase family protein
VDGVVFGNTYYPDHHGCYLGRYVGLRAGVPDSVPGFTVNLVCSAGLYSVAEAANHVAYGEASLCATGGTENISGLRKDMFLRSFNDASCGSYLSKAAEDLGLEFGITREAQDGWALRSHVRALKAQREGRFDQEIVGAGGASKDDAILDSPTLDLFQASESINEPPGPVTKANIHGIVDGASALLLASEQYLQKSGKKPLGRYVAGAFSGVEPKRMSYASVVAMEKALAKSGLRADDIDLFEFNETFAAQVLVDVKALKIPEERVNVNGGAIALGHPFSASGARLIHTVLLELAKRGLRYGAAAISAGGGQGAAVIVERV